MVIGHAGFEPSENTYAASVEILTVSKPVSNAVMWS